MTDLSSYAIEDFVPFTAEVYFRLIERVSETWWPLHLLTLTAGLAATGLAWSGRARSAGGLIAAALAWVSATFLLTGYARLNWAGSWFGWAFLLASALLLLSALTQPVLSRMPARTPRRRDRVPGLAGLALTALGVPLYPLIAPLAGRDWSQAEIFGIHPDPTAVATLGIALLTLRGYRLWLTAIVPLLWCLVSALTLQVLKAPSPGLLYAAMAVALSGMLWLASTKDTRISAGRVARDDPGN